MLRRGRHGHSALGGRTVYHALGTRVIGGEGGPRLGSERKKKNPSVTRGGPNVTRGGVGVKRAFKGKRKKQRTTQGE